MSDQITASLATIPKRTVPLKEMLDSITNQVTLIQLYLNGFEDDQIPDFVLKNNKIKIYRSQEEKFGDRGDAGKFFNVQNIKGWHLICDDDIHYPTDYAQSMIEKCIQYDRKFVIGCHGGDFNQYPVKDAYKDRRNMSHYRKTTVENDYIVQFLATNSVCFHDDTLSLHHDEFPKPNMGDIWFGLCCQKRGVGMVCRAKKANWITDCKNYNVFDSIYGNRYKKEKGGNADIQTQAVNSLGQPWRHYGNI